MRRQVLDHPGFRRRRLEVAGGPGIGVKVFVDGANVARERNVWKVVDDNGTTLDMTIAPTGFSLSTTLNVGTARFTMPPPISHIEYVLAALPLALLVGGAVGGGLGAVAAGLNVRLLASGQPAVLRYLEVLAITATAFGLWAAVATAITSARS